MITRNSLRSFLVLSAGFAAGWFLTREGFFPTRGSGSMPMADATVKGWLPAVSVVWIGLVLLILLSGIPGLFRDRGHQRFAATLLFDSLFRPRQLSALQSYHSVFRAGTVLLMIYLAGFGILTGFRSWEVPLLLSFLALLPTGILYFTDRPSHRPGRFFVCLMGPKLMVMAGGVLLFPYPGNPFFSTLEAVPGFPEGCWLAVTGMLVFRKMEVNTALSVRWGDHPRLASAGRVMLAGSVQVLALALILWSAGTATAEEKMADALGLSAGPLAEIPRLPLWTFLCAAGLALISGVLSLAGRGRRG